MSSEKRGLIVAIDGPSGAGKSTVAKQLARRLGYLYIDTGAMYRAIGLKAYRHNPALNNADEIAAIARTSKVELCDLPDRCHVYLDGEDVTDAIRAEPISQAASIVSSLSAVRRILVAAQQEMGRAGAVVLEGRDIGTRVFPQAEVKVFLDASEQTRAQRRFEQNQKKGANLSLLETIKEIRERDQRDSQRQDSPLTRAADAIYIDTSSLTIDEVIQRILKLLDGRSKSSDLRSEI